ncbi:sphinganine C4-monooxygenase 1-like [Oryza glaberrima]|uniref:aldehyde oxygenase (deformylating) n=1 Tax=Oryza glaberrima TaxID=4538 RepID=I1Q236_ORYGL|nr:sphinganine C4-monooxygenase 1-like [Oryza glaberrima]
MDPLSDEALAIVVPIVVYWLYSGLYMALGHSISMDKYRLHSKEEEDAKNLVSKRDVVMGVLLQQLVQAAVAAATFTLAGERRTTTATTASPSSWLAVAARFAVGMVVLDGWQYAWHRWMHTNRFLYRRVHSWHHRLVAPYAFGAQYNHPAEGLLLDTVGGAVAFLASGMSPRASVVFFSLCTAKGVDDHCGLWLPAASPLQRVFRNTAAYHDVHHQRRGGRYNFSQPFFVTWDKVFGTHMPYVVEERPGGGLQVRPVAMSPSSATAAAGAGGK